MISLETTQASDSAPDRRIMVRRTDDYFWLERLGAVTGDGCLVVNNSMRIDYCDSRIANLLEIPESTVEPGENFSHVALHLSELGYFGPGDPRAFQALIVDLLTNQRKKQDTKPHVIRMTTPQGRQIVMTITYGRDDRFIIVIQDRTEAFFEEQALATALKIGESGYWFYNVQTKEFRMHGGQLLHSGLFDLESSSDPKVLHAIIHKDDRRKVYSTLDECLATRKPQHVVCRVVDRNGDTHWLKNHLMPNVDETNTVRSVICFFNDITRQLRSQDELRSAQDRAERALKAKNAFLARLSHEVRTPMNAVIGMADALIHHHNDPAINPKLALMQDSAEKIVRLVDETLQHTKLQEDAIELDPRDVSVKELAERSIGLWTEQARKSGTELKLHVSDDVPAVMVLDDFRLEQCLNNLLSNAVKFTEGGRVDLVLGMAGGPNSRKFVIAVRDTGIGMTKAQLKQVFLPYKQADKSITGRFGGTGLGMAITKDLVELMGGDISVKSDEGQGTTFVVTLPSVLPGDNAVGSDELVGGILQMDDEAPSDYSRLRVLIVDDNATNHTVIGSLLSGVVGYTQTAMNGEEAIECLEAEPFDLVLMDIHMPVMDGIEATLAIRSSDSTYSTTPIVALTADPQYQQSRLCKNIGMDDALSKPVRLSSMLVAFDSVLKARSQIATQDETAHAYDNAA